MIGLAGDEIGIEKIISSFPIIDEEEANKLLHINTDLLLNSEDIEKIIDNDMNTIDYNYEDYNSYLGK